MPFYPHLYIYEGFILKIYLSQSVSEHRRCNFTTVFSSLKSEDKRNINFNHRINYVWLKSRVSYFSILKLRETRQTKTHQSYNST